MKEYACHITCQGIKKGPFAFSQLRRMRLDGELSPEAFTPREWSALIAVLDSSEIHETSFWNRNPLVEVKRVETEETECSGLQRLLICLTWIGYCIAAFFVVWGLLRAEEGFFWQSPALLIALCFSVLLGRTAVGRLARRKLFDSGKKITVIELYDCYIYGLFAVAMVVGVGLGVCFFSLPRATLLQRVYDGGWCLGAAAVFCARLPASCHAKWRSVSLDKQEPYSMRWILLPILVFVFLVADYYSDQIAPVRKATNYAKMALFKLDWQADAAEWKYPVRIGSSRRKVEYLYGKPDRVVEGEHRYDKAGIAVWFNFIGRVTRLRITNLAQEPSKSLPLAWGLTTGATIQELRAALGFPSATVAFADHQICEWSKPPFRISAEVWTEQEGLKRPGAKAAVRSIEIASEDPLN